VFEFPVTNPVKVSYFNLEICEYLPEAPNKKQIIGKTSLHTSSKFFSEDNKVTLQTNLQSDCTLCFVLDASEELKTKIHNSAKNNPPTTPRANIKEVPKEEGLSYGSGQLDFLKLGPLFFDFVLSVSPLVLVIEKMYSFFTWANPHETLLYSAAFMVIYFYYRGLAIVFFIVFFRYSSLVIAEAIKAKPLQETAETKLQIYKRNILFIQVKMKGNIFWSNVVNSMEWNYQLNLMNIT